MRAQDAALSALAFAVGGAMAGVDVALATSARVLQVLRRVGVELRSRRAGVYVCSNVCVYVCSNVCVYVCSGACVYVCSDAVVIPYRVMC